MATVIALLESTTDVRGNCGASAWIAKITGIDRAFDFQRVFCRKDKSEPASGVLYFDMRGPGLYEFRDFCLVERTRKGTRNRKWSGFVVISSDGAVEHIDRDRALELAEAF
jgi:hypothetical protein